MTYRNDFNFKQGGVVGIQWSRSHLDGILCDEFAKSFSLYFMSSKFEDDEVENTHAAN